MNHPESWCPDGYNQLSPYLIVENADGLLAFVRQVFDAEFLRRFEDEDGGVVHAEARVGDTVIMVADSVEAWPPVPPHLHLYVPDVDATFARALEAGAEDMSSGEGWVEVITPPDSFAAVKSALESAGFVAENADLTERPATLVAVSGEQATAVMKLIERLEDLDDVQNVYSNADLPDEVLDAA